MLYNLPGQKLCLYIITSTITAYMLFPCCLEAFQAGGLLPASFPGAYQETLPTLALYPPPPDSVVLS
jgi:hypothetical protein